MEKLLSIKEAAEILSVNPRTVNRMINRGELAAVKVGNRWRIKPEDVEKLLAGNERSTEKGSDQMYQVLGVRAIPESDGKGFEVEIMPTKNAQVKKEEASKEITEIMGKMAPINVFRLLDFARALANKSERDRIVYERIKARGGLKRMKVKEMLEIGEELNLSAAEMEHYFFPDWYKQQ